jgi:hypothetical protein
VSVIGWLLEGDPAIRWQVLRDLTNASADDVTAERARVEHDGWGARLLALENPDGLPVTQVNWALPQISATQFREAHGWVIAQAALTVTRRRAARIR